MRAREKFPFCPLSFTILIMTALHGDTLDQSRGFVEDLLSSSHSESPARQPRRNTADKIDFAGNLELADGTNLGFDFKPNAADSPKYSLWKRGGVSD
jgi:hypothetical protein